MKRRASRAWRGWLVVLSLGTAACSAILGFDGDVIDPVFPPSEPPAPSGDDASTTDASDAGIQVTVKSTTFALVQANSASLELELLTPTAGTTFTVTNLPAGVTVKPPNAKVTSGAVTFQLSAGAFAPRFSTPKQAKLVVQTGGVAREIPLTITVSGPMDPEFGDGGTTALGLRSTDGVTKPDAVGLDVDDGGILVAFSDLVSGTTHRGVVARLTEKGAVDPAFGDAGKVALDADTRAFEIAQLPDGTALVGGVERLPSGYYRLLTGSIVDGGVASTDAWDGGQGVDQGVFSVVPLSAGGAMIVGVGVSSHTLLWRMTDPPAFPVGDAGPPTISLAERRGALKQNEDLVIVFGESTADRGSAFRYRTLDSTLDKTFKAVPTDLGVPNDFRAASLADGGIVFTGGVATGPALTFNAFFLTRTGANGILDTQFGDAGRTIVKPSAIESEANAQAVVVQPDGRILVGGFADVSGVREVAFARFEPNGVLDKSFGLGGFLLIDLQTNAEVKRMKPQGKGIVVAVLTNTSGVKDVVLMRIAP